MGPSRCRGACGACTEGSPSNGGEWGVMSRCGFREGGGLAVAGQDGTSAERVHGGIAVVEVLVDRDLTLGLVGLALGTSPIVFRCLEDLGRDAGGAVLVIGGGDHRSSRFGLGNEVGAVGVIDNVKHRRGDD